MSEETTAETTAKGRTSRAFRCLNCFTRISPPKGVTTYKCPSCGFEWRISWPRPNLPRIRGPGAILMACPRCWQDPEEERYARNP